MGPMSVERRWRSSGSPGGGNHHAQVPPVAGPATDPATSRSKRTDAGRGTLLGPSPRRAVPVVTVLCAAAVVALAVVVAGRQGPIGPDGPVDSFLIDHRFQYNTPASAIGAMSHPARFALLLLVLVAICLAFRSTKAAALVVGAIGVDLVASEVIKELVRRRQILPGYTFPSGHTATAAVIAAVAIIVCRRNGPLGRHIGRAGRVIVTPLAVVLVVVVGTSVILIQDHYFTDTLGAVPLGVAVTLLVAAAIDGWAARHPSRWLR